MYTSVCTFFFISWLINYLFVCLIIAGCFEYMRMSWFFWDWGVGGETCVEIRRASVVYGNLNRESQIWRWWRALGSAYFVGLRMIMWCVGCISIDLLVMKFLRKFCFWFFLLGFFLFCFKLIYGMFNSMHKKLIIPEFSLQKVLQNLSNLRFVNGRSFLGFHGLFLFLFLLGLLFIDCFAPSVAKLWIFVRL